MGYRKLYKVYILKTINKNKKLTIKNSMYEIFIIVIIQIKINL
jgi:hypothetical protein